MDGSGDDLADDERIGDGDLSDLLSELRVLLPGAQMLTAFLIILPFNGGFAQIQRGEKYVYVATFLCALASLIFFAAPPPSTASSARSWTANASSTGQINSSWPGCCSSRSR